jgi:hypothetical protein
MAEPYPEGVTEPGSRAEEGDTILP